MFKSIRNNWLTGKLNELEFFIDGEKLVARWTDLIDLFNFEKGDLTNFFNFFIYGFFFLEKYNAMSWHKNLANAMAPRNLQHKLK